MLLLKVLATATGVHRVMAELTMATDKAVRGIAEGQEQLQKSAKKVRAHTHTRARMRLITGYLGNNNP